MIVIGCCNRHGGLLTLEREVLTHVNKLDVRGTVYANGLIYFVTRSHLYSFDGKRSTELERTHVANDLHGLHWHDGALWLVDPVHDVIFETGLDGKLKHKWKWVKPNNGRWHTNDIWLDDYNVYTSSFVGGICLNGKQLDWGKNTQPHSVILRNDDIFYCASNKGQVFKGPKLFCSPGGFTRGLLATDDGLWVGSSADRHGAGGKNARIQLYDWDGALQREVTLPTNEVYAITTTGVGARP